MNDILDEAEVAALLACEPSTVQTMAREGALPAVKFGKHWRFPRAALLEVVNRKALENTAPKPRAQPRAAPVTAFGVKRTCRETAQLFGIPERTLYRWSQGGAVDVGSLITSSAARATTPSVVGQ